MVFRAQIWSLINMGEGFQILCIKTMSFKNQLFTNLRADSFADKKEIGDHFSARPNSEGLKIETMQTSEAITVKQ